MSSCGDIVQPEGDVEGFFVGVDADVEHIVRGETNCVEPFGVCSIVLAWGIVFNFARFADCGFHKS